MIAALPRNTVERARASLGRSEQAICRCVANLLQRRGLAAAATLVDIGCGVGHLWDFVRTGAARYVGVDAVQYDSFPETGEFHPCDLDVERIPLADAVADAAVAIETIEHLENPRRFVRELRRVTKPGGLIVITTPNQLSLLSKLTLLAKNQFNAFQEAPGLYPCHRTALLEVDLIRIATECSLESIRIDYSNLGRIAGTRRHWPSWLGFRGRAFSDNVVMSAIRSKQ